MNYKVGDFVRFVDERIEGHITRIIDKDTLGVTDENDFEIPVLASKVTLVHQDLRDEGVLSEIPSAAKRDAPFQSKGVSLGFISDQHASSVVHMHLINSSSFHLLVSLTTESNGNFQGEFAGILAPESTKRLYSAQLQNIQIWPQFRLEIIFNTPENQQPEAAIIFEKKFSGKDFSQLKQDIEALKQKGWLITLDSNEPTINAEELKRSFFK